MADKTKVLDKDYSDDFKTVTIKFLESGEVLSFDIGTLKPETVVQAACHGLVQKLGDAAAGKQGDEAYDAVMAVYERLVAGDWSKARESAGPRPSMVAEAVIRAKEAAGLTVDKAAILAKYTGKDAGDARKAALSNAAVKAAYDQLKLESAQARAAKSQAAASGVDVSSL